MAEAGDDERRPKSASRDDRNRSPTPPFSPERPPENEDSPVGASGRRLSAFHRFHAHQPPPATASTAVVMTVPHNQRRPGSARLTVAASSSVLALGAIGRARESSESVGEALPEATVTDVLRN